MFRYLIILMGVAFLSGTAQAFLVNTKDNEAVCSNGQQANFRVTKTGSNDWFVYLEGGGVAPTPESYRKRESWQKQPKDNDNYGNWFPIVEDFINKGFNVVVIPYCTSDLHQGSHINVVDGEKVYFHGRKIVEDVFSQMDGDFKSANQLVFAGYSAGAIGLGFNADLIAQYDNPKIIVDSFWLDTESRRVRDGWVNGPWPAITKFLYNDNLPSHCEGNWQACFPQRSKFESLGLKNIFPIWNLGDPYIKGELDKVKQSIVDDIEHYNAGFSIDAEPLGVQGFEHWGHVVTANEHYTQTFDGVTVKMLIDNWLAQDGKTMLIKH